MANDKDRRPVRPLTQRIAPLVKTYMRANGITQVNLADELDRDQSYVSERVSGKRPFTTDELDAIAKLAGAQPRELIEYLAEQLADAPVTDIRSARRRVARSGETERDKKAAAREKAKDRGEEV